jgi:hypothetical protein
MCVQRVSHGLIGNQFQKKAKEDEKKKEEKKTHLHALIVQIQTKRNSPPEYLADFWSIAAFLRPRFHPSFFMHNTAFDYSISDSLAYDVFSVFLRI